MALKESNKDRKKRLAREEALNKMAKNAEPKSGVEGWISIDKIPYYHPTSTQTKWIVYGVLAAIVALLIL